MKKILKKVKSMAWIRSEEDMIAMRKKKIKKGMKVKTVTTSLKI